MATLADGTEVSIRAITAHDLAHQQVFFDALSAQARHCALLDGITQPSPEAFSRLCGPSDDGDVAFVVTADVDGTERQIGLGRCTRVSGEKGAELAVTVLDDWLRRGVELLLLERLVMRARERGVSKLFSIQRADSSVMRELEKRFEATIEPDPEEAGQVIARLTLDAAGNSGTNQQVREVLEEIARLEQELGQIIQSQQERIRYSIEGTKIRFEQAVREGHARMRTKLPQWLRESSPRNVLSAPFVYAMIVPFAILDIGLSAYQAICFRLYGVPRVARSQFIVIDRQSLSYLNSIERLNCIYCGYASGLLAYAREIAARTEQYWCPIKHARKVLDPHRRYARFADYGDAADYYEHLQKMRTQLAEEDGGQRVASSS